MTAPLRPIHAPELLPRPSARVSRVAEILDCDEGDVRRLLDQGKLEGHRKGKRGIRVYLDSVRYYQEGAPFVPTRIPRGSLETFKRRPAAASTAAHLSAMASLRAKGIV